MWAAAVVAGAAGACQQGSAPSIARRTALHHDQGPQRGLDAELTPVRSLGDRLELRLDLASHFAAAGKARWAIEVASDVGAAVGAPVLAAPVGLAGGGHVAATITTPERLADGFYVVRVTAAARAGEMSDVAVLERYLEARGGEVTPIDADDYQSRSRAMMGGVL
jgi:hypothetical protein